MSTLTCCIQKAIVREAYGRIIMPTNSGNLRYSLVREAYGRIIMPTNSGNLRYCLVPMIVIVLKLQDIKQHIS
jgi:hypothetical protein